MTVSTSGSTGRAAPVAAASLRHGRDELDVHERARRVVDQHDAVERRRHLLQSREHRVLPGAAARHHGRHLAPAREQVARGACSSAGTTATIVST